MSKIDDILTERGKYSAGVERQDVTLHGLTNAEAKQQIKDLIRQEVIGRYDSFPSHYSLSDVLLEQDKRVEDL